MAGAPFRSAVRPGPGAREAAAPRPRPAGRMAGPGPHEVEASERDVPEGAVLACIERPSEGLVLLQHGQALARALDAPLVLLQVLDPGVALSRPADPLVSAVRRREARLALDRLAASGRGAGDAEAPPLALVVEGNPAREICRIAHDRRSRVIVLARHRGPAAAGLLGSTAREVLDHPETSLLLLPPEPVQPFSRGRSPVIAVPLDGSEWAESALPTAAAIARREGAEIRLLHVLEPLRFNGKFPPELCDLALRRQLAERATALAERHLEHVRRMLAAQGVAVSTRILVGDDPRTALLSCFDRDPVDLMVLSARGHSRSQLADLPLGGVASYLAARAAVPLLIVVAEGAGCVASRAPPESPPGSQRLPA